MLKVIKYNIITECINTLHIINLFSRKFRTNLAYSDLDHVEV